MRNAAQRSQQQIAKAVYAVLPATVAREALKAVPQYGLLLGFVALCAVLSILSPVFFTSSNLFNVALQASVIAVLAFGQTFVILSRGIDLSVGSVLALSGAVMATFTGRFGVAIGLIVGLLLGGILGTTNGVFVTRAKVAPFVATLAMLAVARGLTYIYTGGQPITVHSVGFNSFGQGTFGPVPVPVVIMFVVFFISLLVLTQTRFGRYVYAIGSNPEVTRLAGVPIDRYVVAVYAISGMLAGLGALILTARLGTADPNIAVGYELDVIAAVVVGGTSLFGGRGGVFGTLIGALIIAVVGNGMVLLNINPFWTQAVKGAIILLAVLPDSLRRKTWYE
jgi:ribose/xylose/arabinose/galactoside ABC-type transport system permease subunit